MKINRFFYKQFDFYFGLLFALWFGVTTSSMMWMPATQSVLQSMASF